MDMKDQSIIDPSMSDDDYLYTQLKAIAACPICKGASIGLARWEFGLGDPGCDCENIAQELYDYVGLDLVYLLFEEVRTLLAFKDQADKDPLAQAAVLREALAKVLSCKTCNGEGMVYMALEGHVVGEICDCRMIAQDALNNTGAAGQCLLDELEDLNEQVDAMAATIAQLRQDLAAARGER
jgi:hypothetical protein